MTRAIPPRFPTTFRIELGILLVIVAAWLLVYPVGPYAIEDDWAYVRSLEQLHTTGTVRILDWNPMSLVGHLFWGLLFTRVLGFSFTVTRLSVAAMLYLECLAVIALLRYCRVRSAWIWLAVLTLVFNPIHFFQGFTYATDIPAIAWGALALLGYLHGLDGNERRRTVFLLLGSIGAGLSFLVRQNGILVAVALLAYLLLWDRRALRSPRLLLAAFGPAALMVATFSWWYGRVHGPTSTYVESMQQLVDFVKHPSAGEIVRAVFFLAIYLGFFLFPLTFTVPPRSCAPGLSGRRRAGVLLAAAAMAGLFLYLALHDRLTFPYVANKVTQFGYLRPNELLLGDRPVLWTAPAGWLLGIVFSLSLVILVAVVAARGPAAEDPRRRRVARLTLLVLGVQSLGLLTTAGFFFDRHLLVLAPTAVVLFCACLPDQPGPARTVGAALLLPLAWYSIAGAHDVHAFSRAAFRAGDALLKEGIDPHRIDGGYAFDGWQVYAREGSNGPERARPDDAWWVQYLYPSIRTDYAVSLSPALDYRRWERFIPETDRGLLLSPRLERYRVVRTYPYRSYWALATRQVYVLADTSGSAGGGGTPR